MINPPQLSRHQRRRLHTRELLIQAALYLVLEKGYDALTIQDITDQADLGRGTFYIHFKDKIDVIWAVFEDLFQELEKEAHRKFDRQMPQVEYYGLLNLFQHAENHRDLYRVLFGGQGSALLAGRAQDFMAKTFLYDIRNAPLAPGPGFNIPAEIEAQILTGIISRLFYWWLSTPNNYSAEQMAAMTYQVLYRKDPPPRKLSEI